MLDGPFASSAVIGAGPNPFKGVEPCLLAMFKSDPSSRGIASTKFPMPTASTSRYTRPGARLWRFKYTMHGKQKRIALGAYPNVGLAEARRKRDEAKLKIHEGTDPLAERKRHKLVGKFKASNCFGDLAEEYIEMVTKEGRSEATIEKTKWLLEKLRPIAGTPIADLQAVDIFAVLKKIEAQGHFETARRCRSFASRVFRYAAASGRAESDPTTLLRGALIAPRPKHHAALVEPEEVGGFLRALDGYSGYPITLLACKMLPHVMARPGELRLARWAEFDFEKAVWTVPPERMKMRRPHYVPLALRCQRSMSCFPSTFVSLVPCAHRSVASPEGRLVRPTNGLAA